MPHDLVDQPYDVVIECSGHAEAMEVGLAQLAPAGRLVLVGAGLRRPRFDNNRILLNELVVTGAYTYDSTGFDDALALLGSGALPVDLLLADPRPPAANQVTVKSEDGRTTVLAVTAHGTTQEVHLVNEAGHWRVRIPALEKTGDA